MERLTWTLFSEEHDSRLYTEYFGFHLHLVTSIVVQFSRRLTQFACTGSSWIWVRARFIEASQRRRATYRWSGAPAFVRPQSLGQLS